MSITAEDLAGLSTAPRGKRTARTVRTIRGTQLRLYVGGRLHARGVSPEVARQWVERGFAIVRTM